MAAPPRSSMNTNPYSLSTFYPFLILGFLIIILAVGGDAVRIELSYDREAIQQGEVWRLVTGHLVHLGWSHAGMNLLGLFMVFIFFSRWFRTSEWLLASLFYSLFISLTLYLFNPDVTRYVGFSGVLHGLLIMGAVKPHHGHSFQQWAVIILVVGKLIWEQLQGPVPGSENITGGLVIVDAHLYGAVAGLLLYGIGSRALKGRTFLPRSRSVQ